MQVGWTGLGRAIGLTAALTSALWIALGAWLFHGHINEDRHRGLKASAPPTGSPSPGSKPTANPVANATAPASILVHRVGTLNIPVAGITPDKLVDTFAQARAAGARHHDAIDILAPEGAPVVAASPGYVEKLFLSEAGGNTIYVRSDDRRMIYYYAHLAAYARDLREGWPCAVGNSSAPSVTRATPPPKRRISTSQCGRPIRRKAGPRMPWRSTLTRS